MIKGKDKELECIKAYHNDYVFVVAKHPRFSWVSHTQKEYMYFLYITRLENHFLDKNTANIGKFNILCHQQVFFDYHQMMTVIEPILSEYILDSKTIFKIAMQIQELEYHNEDPLQQASGE